MKIKINGNEYNVLSGTILDAAKANGIDIPTLCYLKDANTPAACRMCLVEVKGIRNPVPACTTNVTDGMEITTDSPFLFETRKMNLELLCRNHVMECTECARGMDCRLRELCSEYGVDDKAFGIGSRQKLIYASEYLVRDNTKCVLCRRCVGMCSNIQGIGAINANYKGAETNIGFAHGIDLSSTQCVACGQCVSVCPTGALSEKDDTKQAWKAILRRINRKTTVALVSIHTAAQIDELLGDNTYTHCTGKTAAMLRRIGYDKVYIIDDGVTVCPAWRNYLRIRHHTLWDKLPNESTQFESFAKEYKSKIGQADITAFTPCLASKTIPGSAVDTHLTTRELATMWKRACVSNFTALSVWKTLESENFDEYPFQFAAKATHKTVFGLAAAEGMLQKGILTDITAVLACPGGCSTGGGSPAFSGTNIEDIINKRKELTNNA